MAAEAEFTIGAGASCSDGHCGEVRRLIIDPATDTITHLVIQPGHDKEAARLVPMHLVETTDGGVRLRCTRTEFDQLDHAEKPELGGGRGPGFGYNIGHDPFARALGDAASAELINKGPMPGRHKTFVEDVVPVGEDQVSPGDRVHAVDGEIGRVQGFLVNPDDNRLTRVLLQEGHLWGHKEVAIPISAVTGVDAGIRLNLTKEQIGNLPPAD
jgi:sporulation protein YlmC with PRC-barrel domain